jgi:hypothetical protein
MAQGGGASCAICMLGARPRGTHHLPYPGAGRPRAGDHGVRPPPHTLQQLGPDARKLSGCQEAGGPRRQAERGDHAPGPRSAKAQSGGCPPAALSRSASVPAHRLSDQYQP